MTTFLFAKCSGPLPVEHTKIRLNDEHTIDIFFQRLEDNGSMLSEYIERVIETAGSELVYAITETPGSNHFEDVIDKIIDVHDLRTNTAADGIALFQAVECLSRLIADILFHDERVVQLFLCANSHSQDSIIRLSGSRRDLAIAMADHMPDLVFLPDLILARA